MTPVTIDEAIRRLVEIRKESRLNGKTVLTLCEKGREYTDIRDIKFDDCDGDGGLVLICLEGE